MTTTSSSSGLTYKLHPLVVVNISDHVTRAKVISSSGGSSSSNSSASADAEAADATARVAGCLLGSVGGATRTVDVANSFELVVPVAGARPDAALLRRRLDQYKQTFPALDLVGWYAVGPLSQPPGGAGTTAAAVHDALSPAEGSEAAAPFGLVFDPTALLLPGGGSSGPGAGPGGPSSARSPSRSPASVRTSVAGLPIRLWEWVPVGGGGASDGGASPAPSAAASANASAAAAAAVGGGAAAGAAGGSWSEAPFTIDSSEIERIGVAQAARAVPAGADESGTDQLVGHFKSLHTAVSTMASRIEEIRAAVSAMASGEREVDRGAIRAAAALLKSAKNIGGGGAASSSTSSAAATAEADALAMLLLASVTHGISESASLVEAVAAGAPKAVPVPPAAAQAQQGGSGGGGGRPQRQQRQQQHSRRDRDRDFGGGSGSGRRRGGSGGDAYATMVS